MVEMDGDAFISYAHLDNVCLAEGQRGWVANLHRALEIRVAQLLGKEARIWWDPKLHGNDLLSETLIARLQRAGALVSVVSPRYIRSEWTLRELEEFCKAAEGRGGIHIRDKSRLFKVLKTPVAVEQHPPQLQPLIGYEFFRIEPGSGRVRELDQIFGPEAQRDFWIKLDDLAHDICALLQLLHAPPSETGARSAGVFLADTTSDLRAERDAVRRALQQQGYTVLPAHAAPLAAADATAAAREDLARCRISIHMFGRTYGLVPEGGTASLPELQDEAALERAARGAFGRLIWIPPGLQFTDERQRQVIDRLRMDQRVQGTADLLETSLEDLQTVITAWLKRDAKRRGRPAANAPGASALLYLVYDARDIDTIAPWADFLFEHAEVVPSSFEGDEAELREYHEENLRTSDGVLIFHGAASPLWLRRKLSEIQKSAGYGRGKAPAEVAVVLVPPDTHDKAHFRTRLATVIEQTDGFAPAALLPFVEALQARARGSPG